jgi:hypothetical protein
MCDLEFVNRIIHKRVQASPGKNATQNTNKKVNVIPLILFNANKTVEMPI